MAAVQYCRQFVPYMRIHLEHRRQRQGDDRGQPDHVAGQEETIVTDSVVEDPVVVSPEQAYHGEADCGGSQTIQVVVEEVDSGFRAEIARSVDQGGEISVITMATTASLKNTSRSMPRSA